MQQSAKTSVVDNSSSVSQISGLTGPQNQEVPSDINLTPGNKGDNFVKLKPPNHSGTDEFEDFLVQFEVTSAINGWNYKAKSLYLANSLMGTARLLLSELTDEQRRDYNYKAKSLYLANSLMGTACLLLSELTDEQHRDYNYKAKSLYLANSLMGTACLLLSELTDEQRRDYNYKAKSLYLANSLMGTAC